MATAQIVIKLPWETYIKMKSIPDMTPERRSILINQLLTDHFKEKGKTNE